MLRGLAEAGTLPSLLLWGPPGSGKTTLAFLMSAAVGARQVSLSAVTSGVADIRRVIAEARQARKLGHRTVLFIDELHRWNKSQQDAVLPRLSRDLRRDAPDRHAAVRQGAGAGPRRALTAAARGRAAPR